MRLTKSLLHGLSVALCITQILLSSKVLDLSTIDPSNPAERLRHMISDADLNLILSHPPLGTKIQHIVPDTLHDRILILDYVNAARTRTACAGNSESTTT